MRIGIIISFMKIFHASNAPPPPPPPPVIFNNVWADFNLTNVSFDQLNCLVIYSFQNFCLLFTTLMHFCLLVYCLHFSQMMSTMGQFLIEFYFHFSYFFVCHFYRFCLHFITFSQITFWHVLLFIHRTVLHWSTMNLLVPLVWHWTGTDFSTILHYSPLHLANVLTAWTCLMTWHTFWRFDALFNVITNCLTSWCVQCFMTNFLLSWRIFDVMTSFLS